MKLCTGWVISAGLLVAAGAANAQVLAPYEVGRSPYRVVSDIGGPYAAMPPEARVPDYVPGYYGPRLLPPHEVYTVLRDGGFSPLGIPVRRGFFYTISVIDRGGDDGRLVIDARNGRILRFRPANRMDDNFDDAVTTYGPLGRPPAADVRGEPRPPRAASKVANRTPGVPVPKPRAGEAKPLAATTPAVQPAQPAAVQPTQQSAAAVPASPPATGQTAAPAAAAAAPPAAVEAKPAPQILPTQDMPQAQGLE